MTKGERNGLHMARILSPFAGKRGASNRIVAVANAFPPFNGLALPLT
jgi:hypothetical protein